MTVAELPEAWNKLADTVAPFADPAARAFRLAALELTLALEDEGSEMVDKETALALSAYSPDHLRRLEKQGKVVVEGRGKDKRYQRRGLPRKPKASGTRALLGL